MKKKKFMIINILLLVVIALFVGFMISNKYLSGSFAEEQPKPSVVINDSTGKYKINKSSTWISDNEAKVTLEFNSNYQTINADKTDLILILDRTHSMIENEDKWETVKTAASQLVNKVLNIEGNRAAVITFDTWFKSSTDNTKVPKVYKYDFVGSSGKNNLINYINGLEVEISDVIYNGWIDCTRYADALGSTNGLIDLLAADNNRSSDSKYLVVFLTDGGNNADGHLIQPHLDTLNSSYGSIMDIVGIKYRYTGNVTFEDSGNRLSQIVNYNKSDGSGKIYEATNEDLLEKFEQALQHISFDSVSVKDYINTEYFDYVDGSISTTSGTTATFDSSDNSINWNMSNVPTGETRTLSFNIKVKSGDIKIIKTDEKDGTRLNGAKFKISSTKSDCSDTSTIYTTSNDGTVTINNLKSNFATTSLPTNNKKNLGVGISINAVLNGNSLNKTDSSLTPILKYDNSDYYVCEVEAPTGYKINNSSKKISVISGTVTPITIEDARETGTIKIEKVDSVTNAKISGAIFGLKRCTSSETSSCESSYVNGYESFEIINGEKEIIVEPGYYMLEELKAPSGYAITDTSYQIKKITSKNTTTYSFKNVPYGSIVISKIDKDTKNALKGAQFELYKCDSNNSCDEIVTKDIYGNPIAKKATVAGNIYYYLCTDSSCSSTGTNQNGLITIDNLEQGNYKIKEVVAPVDGKQGYKLLDNPVSIKLSMNGTCSLVTKNNPCSEVTISDEPIAIRIVKGAMDNSLKKLDKKLVGAIFRVKEYNSSDNIYDDITISDKSGIKVGIKPGKYEVIEVLSPEGYALMEEKAIITVDNYGNITLSNSKYTTISDSTITFYDKPSNLIVSKLDSSTKKPLEGVELNIKCDDGYEITWTTTTEDVEIGINDNAKCVIKEVNTPDGYEKELTELNFTIDEDGNIVLDKKLDVNSNWKIEKNKITLYNGFKVPATASLISIITIILGVSIIGGGITFVIIASKKKKRTINI